MAGQISYLKVVPSLANILTNPALAVPSLTFQSFLFIGHDPNSGLAKGLVALDERGYIVTDGSLATSVPGVCAAGEVRKGAVRQLVAACGEGCAAALAAQAAAIEAGPEAGGVGSAVPGLTNPWNFLQHVLTGHPTTTLFPTSYTNAEAALY